MDDIKLFAKNHKEKEVVRYKVKILGWNLNIEKCVVLIMRREKRQMTKRIELLSKEKIRTLGGKEIYRYLGILLVDTRKHVGDERKKVPQKIDKTTQN